MKTRNTIKSGTVMAVALTLACADMAMAQGRGGPPQKDDDREPPTAAEFIKRLDTDGDGKVSKQEFDGPAEHFAAVDSNEDGFISEDEAPTGPPPRRGEEGDAKQGEGREARR